MTEAKEKFSEYLSSGQAPDENAGRLFQEWKENASIMKRYMERGEVPYKLYNDRNMVFTYTFVTFEEFERRRRRTSIN